MKAAEEAIGYTDHLRKMRQANLELGPRESVELSNVVVWHDNPKTFSVFQN